MEKWKEIASQRDIDKLLSLCEDFHDACIVSMRYQSGAFVDDRKAMHCGSSYEYELLVVFHSQGKPKTIELCFSGLRRLHLTGWQDNYFCNIEDAHVSFYDDLLPGDPGKVIVWADCRDFDTKKLDHIIREPSNTYIVANALKWRIAPNHE